MKILKVFGQVAAIAAGTAYVMATFFLVLNAPSLDGARPIFGYTAAAFAQFLAGGFLIGLGLGVCKIAR